ncbi:MAG: OmpA family protein [Betaproteobacteria bacterium]
MKKLLLSGIAMLAACTTTPPPDAEMSAARAMLSQSQPLASQYAAGELRAAQGKLERAEALYAREQYTEARLLAEQAEVDAKLAWSIAENERARRALAEVQRFEARAREAEAARQRAEAEAREARERLQALEQARQAEQSKRLAASEELGAQVRGLESQLPELDARQTERGWVLAIAPDLMFDRGEAMLRPGGRRALESVARVLRQHPDRNILVEGFADDAGGADLNRRLSERRAHAVRNALVLAGVDGANIVARGAGPMESGPAARVQIVIAPEPAQAAIGSGAGR